MAYEALIFDLDGTLWDTSQQVTSAWNQIVQKHPDLPSLSPEQIRSVMGLSHEEAFAQLLPGMDVGSMEVAARQFYDRAVALLHANYLYPGVAEGIAALSKRFDLCIVSNCQPEYLTRFMTLSGLGGFVRDSECYGTTGRPKGDNISSVMRRNRLSNVAYVGDTAGDQIAARQAGADFYFVSYGFGSPAQECMRFDSFDQVTAFFLSLPTKTE